MTQLSFVFNKLMLFSLDHLHPQVFSAHSAQLHKTPPHNSNTGSRCDNNAVPLHVLQPPPDVTAMFCTSSQRSHSTRSITQEDGSTNSHMRSCDTISRRYRLDKVSSNF